MSYSTLQERITTDRKQSVSIAQKRIQTPYNLWYLFFDLLFINLTYSWMLNPMETFSSNIFFIALFFFLLNCAWLLTASLQHTYPHWGQYNYLQAIQKIGVAILTHLGLLFLITFFLFEQMVEHETLVQINIFLLIGLAIARGILQLINRRTTKAFNYIIVGGKEANIDSIQSAFGKAYFKKANCLGRFGRFSIEKTRNLGIEEDLISYVHHSKNLQRIVYVNSDLDTVKIEYLMKVCATKFIDFMVIPKTSDLFSKGTTVESYYGLPIFLQKRDDIARLRFQILKRIFDLLFSALVIVFILSWMIPLVALLIKLESKGPVFFLQKRTGYFNNHFTCIKFRSMQVNENADHKQATKSDHRITKIGAFLRRTNLDEFPQFINVFLGQMSVVGPRPHMLKHTHEYAKIINEFMLRHSVKPGVTGWAQVNGHRGPTETVKDMRLRVEHDIWYIEKWSFILDLKCILMTVINFFKG
ncbi:MAG: exopolysaccharide biosynthesis polyprenyl glycosylphosphotransferase, partial [Bacteroidota bacterium]